MNIIIFGPPLSGKGTQAKKLLQDFQLTHLSTGDALRQEKAKKTPLGIQAAAYSDKGLLAPDDLVAKIVEAFYSEHKQDGGILFDGYPRNRIQAEHLMTVLQHDDATIDQIFLLKVPESTLLLRAAERAKEQNREDDKDSNIVLQRIEEFNNGALPALEYIQDLGIPVKEIHGERPIDETYKEIKAFLDEKNKAEA